jgi:hypothetical protein
MNQISKTPHLHSHVLENWTTAQLPIPHAFGKDFHFSCHTTGVTGVSIHHTPQKEVPVAHRAARLSRLCTKAEPALSKRLSVGMNCPGIQTSTLFSTLSCPGRMNTIKK